MTLRELLKGYAKHRPIPWGFLACGVIYWCLLQFFSVHGLEPVSSGNTLMGMFVHPGTLNLAGSVLALLAAIVFESRGEAQFIGALWVMFGTVTLLIGFLIDLLYGLGLLAVELPVTELLVGFGMGFMLIQLSDAFACFELPQALFYVAVEAVVAAPLSLVLAYCLPALVGLACLFALTIVQAILFVRNRRGIQPVEQRVPSVSWKRNKGRAVVVFITVAFLGLCVGFVLGAMPQGDGPYQFVSFVALAVAGLILGFISLQILNQWAEELMLKICVPLITVALLCLTLLELDRFLPLLLCAVCAFCLTGLIWFFSSEYHAESHIGLHRVTAIMFAMTFTCHILGSALGFAVSSSRHWVEIFSAFFLFAIVMLLITVIFGYQKRVAAAMRILEESGKNMLYETIAGEYGLTAREKEIMGLLMNGLTSKQIAEELFISENTVNTHTHRVFQKLGVHSRSELSDYLDARSGPLKNYSDNPVPYVIKP